MNADRHILVVKSSTPPVVELDSSGSAIYIRFKKTKVAKTIEQCVSGPIITVDLDRSGDVVGVEALCWDEFEVGAILRKARVDVAAVDLSRTKFRSAPQFSETPDDLATA